MSGLEVAALVLGVFPLVISGLEHYQKGLKPIRNFVQHKQELIALQAFVSSEYSKFLNSIELLLQPIVSPAELHRLLKDPRRAEWKAPHLKVTLRRRLGSSEEAFFTALRAVEECVQELEAALKEKDYLSRTLHFCFVGNSQRSSTKTKLREANRDLESFVVASYRLSNSRESRSLKLLEASICREELIHLHDALDGDSFHCGCSQHRFYLGASCSLPETSARAAIDALQNLALCLDASHVKAPKTDSVLRTVHVELGGQNQQLDDTTNARAPLSTTTVPTRPPSSSPSTSSIGTGAFNSQHAIQQDRKRLSKKNNQKKIQVSFVLPSEQASAATVSTRSDRADIRRRISSICRLLQSPASIRSNAGYLESGRAVRMPVYSLPPSSHYRIDSGTTPSTLSRALGAPLPSPSGNTRRYRHIELLRPKIRLQLASKLAVLYLQLQSTPWLPGGFTKEAISFLSINRPDAEINFVSPFISHEFIPRRWNARFTRSSSSSKSSPAVSTASSRFSQALSLINQNHTEGLFALGKLLTELALNSRLEDLYEPEDMDNGNITELTEYLAVQRLLPDVFEEQGYLYGEAVRRCVEGVDVREKAIDDPNFRRGFLRDVVQPLQDTSCFWVRTST